MWWRAPASTPAHHREGSDHATPQRGMWHIDSVTPTPDRVTCTVVGRGPSAKCPRWKVTETGSVTSEPCSPLAHLPHGCGGPGVRGTPPGVDVAVVQWVGNAMACEGCHARRRGGYSPPLRARQRGAPQRLEPTSEKVSSGYASPWTYPRGYIGYLPCACHGAEASSDPPGGSWLHRCGVPATWPGRPLRGGGGLPRLPQRSPSGYGDAHT